MNSEIILCKGIKLDKDYKNVLNYTEENMLALCRTKQIAQANNYSFIKHGKNLIEVGFSYAKCLQANYIAFQNPDYSNKWFFAFIDDIEYRSNGSTRIYYTIDEFSTWFDYWDPQACFVVREHVVDDTVGLHTLPENLESGEYIIQSSVHNTELQDTVLVMGSTVTTGELAKRFGAIYHGIYSGICYYSLDVENMTKALEAMSDNAQNIICLFMAPKVLVETVGGVVKDSTQAWQIQDSISPITNIDGYIPKNNKLLTYPYVALNVSNSQGSNAIYRQELFEKNADGNLRFQIEGALTPGCSIRLYPIYYKGISLPYDEAIILGKYPQLNWVTDLYTNWETMNAVNNAVNIGSGLVDIVSASKTGDARTLVSGAVSIANTVQQIHQHKMIPPQAHGNINAGDVVAATNTNTFYYNKLTIKSEYAKIIDDYFDRYGYKINRTKIPNQTSRPFFNYVQIASSENIGYGTVPAKSMEIINNIYRNGTTIWHDHENVGDYSLNNH